eukprot:scaffold9959_cov67-Skeletonema_dohrnii-CCMP3373.AAC.1
MTAPGTGRRGPTYLKNVSSTPSFLGVPDIIDATSSMVACAELFPFIAASWSPGWISLRAPLPS